MQYYPVVIFCFNRLSCLKETISSLSKNYLAAETDLIIFSDGAKKQADRAKVEEVRAYLKTVSAEGFKSVKVKESPVNKGLYTSVITGVSEVLNVHDAIIVLEDDLVTSANFLDFMNEGLMTYKNHSDVISIAGYTSPVSTPIGFEFDNYFTGRAASWGWATWKLQWEKVDWKVSSYPDFKKDRKQRQAFNNMGSDMNKMLDRQMNGLISSWAIVWCYHQFSNQLLTVFPTVSKVVNIGFGEDATHTKGNSNRYATDLDQSTTRTFRFDRTPKLSKFFIKQFIKKYSLRSRLYYKMRSFFKL